MIHIVISVSPRPLTITLHHFETRVLTREEARVGRALRTLLQPFLRAKAPGFLARFKIVE